MGTLRESNMAGWEIHYTMNDKCALQWEKSSRIYNIGGFHGISIAMFDYQNVHG
jgi:hypothetical protein